MRRCTGRALTIAVAVGIPCLSGTTLIGAYLARGPGLPPVTFPAENPFSEEKRVLGKILFWDEQLSSDNTTACGTCHIPSVAGTEIRDTPHPGPDMVLGNDDDIFGSQGVIRSDAANEYAPDTIFVFEPQITPRRVPTMINAAYSPVLFRDGRALGTFIEPEGLTLSILSGGALESQAVGPPVNDIEMAHESRNWSQINSKLESAVPLGLATNLPTDVAAAITANPSYPDLFNAAFGDSAINAERIAYAIATYERTLIADQTPWDLFIAGDGGAMTTQQIDGWNFFQASNCALCHVPPHFTNHTFRNIGVRPPAEDVGRQNVTGFASDRGKFKVPGLRNSGLKPRFMHNGQFTDLNDVLDFYSGGGPVVPFPDNLDPLMPVPVPGFQRTAMVDFMANGLTDPRVANETFPFDRPTLRSEIVPANPQVIATGTTGSGGFTPSVIAVSPPNVGNAGFRIGVEEALGGANAHVVVSTDPPVGGELLTGTTWGPITLNGTGDGAGFGTFAWPIAARDTLEGVVYYMQWRVDDPSGPGGVALSPVAELTLFCNGTCPSSCLGDWNGNGVVFSDDFIAYLNDFAAVTGGGTWTTADPDVAPPIGDLNTADFIAFLNAFSAVFSQPCN